MSGTQRRGRGSIHRRGRDCWLIRVTLGNGPGGEQVRLNKTVRGSKTEAEEALTKLLGDKDGGGLREKPTRQTVGEFVEHHLTSRIDVAERTQDDERGLFQRYLWPDEPNRILAGKGRRPTGVRKDERLIAAAKRLRSTRPRDVTPKMLQAFTNTLTECGLGPRSVRMMHAALRICLNAAVEQKVLAYNPAVRLRLPRQDRREMKFLAPAEALRFLAAAEAEQERLISTEPTSPEAEGAYTFMILMLMTGMRIGEVLGLKWTDLDGSTLRIQRAVSRGHGRRHILGPTKTSQNRSVPIGDRALRALQRHRVTQAKWKLMMGEQYQDQGLIFATAAGGIIQAENLPHRTFRQLLSGAGLPAIRLYDLRHSHATLLMANGVHPKVVQERLGHSSIQLTMDTYSHVVPGMQERATERLEALLASPAAATRA